MELMRRYGKLAKGGFALLFSTSLIVGCSSDDDATVSNEITIAAGTSSDDVQVAFIDAAEGETLVFGEGVFEFTNTLSMDGKTGIKIKGAGRDKTILDFSGQSAGGEGVLITNSNNILIEGLTIRDSKGDALKSRDCNKISFVDIGTVWSGEPSVDNGAYGLYPVLCTQVYIDNCYAYGASDAGIYVGQSDQVILKNSKAEGNVAGIEIENTINADVFNNEATDNTGGILVFDLPGLTQYGKNVRVYDNNVHDNNRDNFAPEGNIVANVPSGTGVMILSTENVEIFNNTLTDNNFAGVMVVNYLLLNQSPNDENYNPWPTGIYIHNNTHEMTGTVDAASQTELVQQLMGVLQLYQLDQPNVLIDGLVGTLSDICIQEGTSTFVNLNAIDQTFQSVSTDVTAHDCNDGTLSAVSFEPYL